MRIGAEVKAAGTPGIIVGFPDPDYARGIVGLVEVWHFDGTVGFYWILHLEAA